MSIKSLIGKPITPSTSNIIVRNANVLVKGDPNLVPSNIPNDTSIFGVTGNLPRTTTTNQTDMITAINNTLGS